MRCYLPDEEKSKIKIANLPIIKHQKIELDKGLSFEEARKYFRYKDGKIYWIRKTTNSIRIGKEAGYINKYKLKRTITFKGKEYLTGEIIFLLVHSYIPKYLMFIDGDTLNTNLSNLTAGNSSKRTYVNLKNKKSNLNLKGINFCKIKKKYVVKVFIHYKEYNLGVYNDIEIAKKTYNLAVKKLYGELAYLNE